MFYEFVGWKKSAQGGKNTYQVVKGTAELMINLCVFLDDYLHVSIGLCG